MFQTIRCVIFLQFLSLHDLQAEVSISNTAKPQFIILLGVLRKDDGCGKTVDVGAYIK
jgi:hypothetical protein